MKRKLLIGALAVISAAACAFGFAACDTDKPETDGGQKWGEVYTLSAAYAEAQELGYTGTLEEFIASISGKDGTDGTDGIGVKNAYVDENGNLFIVLTNDEVKNCGNVLVNSERLAYIAVKEEGEIISYTVRGLGSVSDTDVEVPEQYNGKPVTAVGIKAFLEEVYLTSITLSDEITLIDESAFAYCENLTDIYYGGTIGQWEEVEKGDYWDSGMPAYTVHCSDGDITGEQTDGGQQVTAEEWKAIVLATAYAKNCTITMTDDQLYVMPEETETRTNAEIAMYDLGKGLAYWYKTEETEYENGTNDDSSRTIETYNIFKDGIWSEYYQYDKNGWVYNGQRNTYEDLDEEMLNYKFSIGHGYDAIEMLKYYFRDEMFLNETAKLEDMYEHFTYNGDGTYTYTETNETISTFTISFKDGYILNFNVKMEMENGDSMGSGEMNFDFSDFGTTEVTIPQNVIDNAVPETPSDPDKK